MEISKTNKKLILKTSIVLSSALFIVLIFSGLCNNSSLNQVCPRCSEDSSKCNCCKKCSL